MDRLGVIMFFFRYSSGSVPMYYSRRWYPGPCTHSLDGAADDVTGLSLLFSISLSLYLSYTFRTCSTRLRPTTSRPAPPTASTSSTSSTSPSPTTAGSIENSFLVGRWLCFSVLPSRPHAHRTHAAALAWNPSGRSPAHGWCERAWRLGWP